MGTIRIAPSLRDASRALRRPWREAGSQIAPYAIFNTMPKRLILLLLALSSCKVSPEARRDHIASDMENVLVDNLLNTWYPRCVDSLHGGFLSAFTFDFAPAENQEKMIVTQARHTWTNAKGAMRYPDIAHFKTS